MRDWGRREEEEEEQEFIVSKQQEDMDSATIPRRELGNKIGGDDDEDRVNIDKDDHIRDQQVGCRSPLMDILCFLRHLKQLFIILNNSPFSYLKL